MYTIRELLAIGLAALIGLLLVLKPAAALKLQWFTFDTTSGRRGEWGNADHDQEFAGWMLWGVRAVGLLVVGFGGLILAMPLL